jgi:hypothetical protein
MRVLKTLANLPCAAAKIIGIIAFAALAQPAFGETLLAISGGPNAAGQPIEASFDLAALQALPVTKFETTTMWTEGLQSFEGVALKTLLDGLDVTSGTVIAQAINDYRVEIPYGEITADAPIIAYKMNGAEMSVRDKGPLWIVYPFDSNAKYQSEVVFSRSIWQMNRLEIAP